MKVSVEIDLAVILEIGCTLHDHEKQLARNSETGSDATFEQKLIATQVQNVHKLRATLLSAVRKAVK